MEKGHRQPHQVGKKIPSQAVERGFTGADEALDAEKRHQGLQRQHREKLQHDLVGARQNHRRIHLLPQRVGRIADQFLEEIGKTQRENGSQKQGRERWQESRFFLHQIAENPSQ